MLLCLLMGGTKSSPGQGGVPHPVMDREVPQGTPHPDLGWGIPPPHLDLGWGIPYLDLGRGTPPCGPGTGYPHPDLGWGTPPPPIGKDGVPPPPPGMD